MSGPSLNLRRRVADAITEAHLPGPEREWGLTLLDAAEVGVPAVCGHIGGASLMAEARVIVVRKLEKLAASAQKTLARTLQAIPPDTWVVLDVETSEDNRRRGPGVAADLLKVCQSIGQVVEAGVPGSRDLPEWIVEEARRRGKILPPRAAQVFLATVGSAVDSMLSELDKLVTYVGPEYPEITSDDVLAIVSGEQEGSIFDLVDAIGRRDARAALTTLAVVLPAQAPQGSAMPILAMISRQLRLIWQARALNAASQSLEDGKRVDADFAARLPAEHNFHDTTRGRGFLVRKYVEQARSFSDAQLARALTRVYETDLALKGQSDARVDDRLALETLIVSLCRP